MRGIRVFLVCVFCAVPAVAEVSGERDPVFRSVLQEWLDGTDDLEVLRDLAELARDGNTAAQITLGLIERHQFQALAASMKREDRRAIFRDPGGRFGEPWLRVAGRSNAYAAVLAAPLSPENLDVAFAAAIAEDDPRYAWQAAMIGINATGLPSAVQRLTHPVLAPHGLAELGFMVGTFETAQVSMETAPEERVVLDEIRMILASTSAPAGRMPALGTPLNGLR